jgi:hypothetical protein
VHLALSSLLTSSSLPPRSLNGSRGEDGRSRGWPSSALGVGGGVRQLLASGMDGHIGFAHPGSSVRLISPSRRPTPPSSRTRPPTLSCVVPAAAWRTPMSLGPLRLLDALSLVVDTWSNTAGFALRTTLVARRIAALHLISRRDAILGRRMSADWPVRTGSRAASDGSLSSSPPLASGLSLAGIPLTSLDMPGRYGAHDADQASQEDWAREEHEAAGARKSRISSRLLPSLTPLRRTL